LLTRAAFVCRDLVAVIVLVLCIVGGAAFLFLSKKSGSSSGSQTGSNEQHIPEPDAETQKKLPYLKTKAGPRDGAEWTKRVGEEMTVLMGYINSQKEMDSQWFKVNPINKEFTKWEGNCWYFHEGLKYDFKLTFEIPVAYPAANPDLCLPELMGTTEKMYRGGAICQTLHFAPLWNKSVPRLGIAHALALGVSNHHLLLLYVLGSNNDNIFCFSCSLAPGWRRRSLTWSPRASLSTTLVALSRFLRPSPRLIRPPNATRQQRCW
jgi:ufm1-conjugating enzyme 1